MGEILGPRGLVYWWGLMTTLIFLRDWVRTTAKAVRTAGVFDSRQVPFNFLPTVNDWIDQAAHAATQGFTFDPNAELFVFMGYSVPNMVVAGGLAIGVVGLAAWLYARAVNSRAIYDDFLALFTLYAVLRVESNVARALRQPDAADFLQQTWVYAAALTLSTVFLVMLGKGFRDRRVFWRGVFELIAVYLFLFPTSTAGALATGLDQLAKFGDALGTNLSFGVLWGLAGLLLCFYRLYSDGAIRFGGRPGAGRG